MSARRLFAPDAKAKALSKRLETRDISLSGLEDAPEYAASTFGGFGDYMRNKRLKLQNRDAVLRADSASHVFSGCIIAVQGYTKPSASVIHKLVVQNGGVFLEHIDGKQTVTHVVATILPPKKRQEWERYKVVRPEWVVECVEAGKVLDWRKWKVGLGQGYKGDSSALAKRAVALVRSQEVGLEIHEEGEESETDNGPPPSYQPGQMTHKAPVFRERPTRTFGEEMEDESEEDESDDEPIRLVPTSVQKPRDTSTSQSTILLRTSQAESESDNVPTGPLAIINGVEAYVAEAFIGEKKHPANAKPRNKRGKMKYLVKWKGYPENESTWEWEDTLREDLGDDFYTMLEELRSGGKKEEKKKEPTVSQLGYDVQQTSFSTINLTQTTIEDRQDEQIDTEQYEQTQRTPTHKINRPQTQEDETTPKQRYNEYDFFPPSHQPQRESPVKTPRGRWRDPSPTLPPSRQPQRNETTYTSSRPLTVHDEIPDSMSSVHLSQISDVNVTEEPMQEEEPTVGDDVRPDPLAKATAPSASVQVPRSFLSSSPPLLSFVSSPVREEQRPTVPSASQRKRPPASTPTTPRKRVKSTGVLNTPSQRQSQLIFTPSPKEAADTPSQERRQLSFTPSPKKPTNKSSQQRGHLNFTPSPKEAADTPSQEQRQLSFTPSPKNTVNKPSQQRGHRNFSPSPRKSMRLSQSQSQRQNTLPFSPSPKEAPPAPHPPKPPPPESAAGYVPIRAYVKPKMTTLLDAFAKKVENKKQQRAAAAPAVPPQRPPSKLEYASAAPANRNADHQRLSTGAQHAPLLKDDAAKSRNLASQPGNVAPAPFPFKTPAKSSFTSTQFDLPSPSQIDPAVLSALPTPLRDSILAQQASRQPPPPPPAQKPLETPPSSQFDITTWNDLPSTFRAEYRAEYLAANAPPPPSPPPPSPPPQFFLPPTSSPKNNRQTILPQSPRRNRTSAPSRKPAPAFPAKKAAPIERNTRRVFSPRGTDITSWLFTELDLPPSTFFALDNPTKLHLIRTASRTRDARLDKEAKIRNLQRQRQARIDNAVKVKVRRRRGVWVNSRIGGSGVVVCGSGDGAVVEVRKGVRAWVGEEREEDDGGEDGGPEDGDVEAWLEFVEEICEAGDMRAVRIVRGLLECAGEREGWGEVCRRSVEVLERRWEGIVV